MNEAIEWSAQMFFRNQKKREEKTIELNELGIKEWGRDEDALRDNKSAYFSAFLVQYNKIPSS